MVCLSIQCVAIENPCPIFLQQFLSQFTPQQQNKIFETLKKDPELLKEANEFFELLPKIQSGQISVRDPHLLDLVENVGAKLVNTGKLSEILKQVAVEVKKMGKLPASLSPQKLDELITMASTAFDAELSARGLTQLSAGVKYEAWSSLAARLTTETQNAVAAILRKHPGQSGFEIPEFVKTFEKQTHTSFTKNNEIELLVNGSASFPMRAKLIENEKESINIMSWAFYDDITGNTFADQLIKKAKEGVPVRVMVDGQVALQPEHLQVLKRMEDNGCQVIRWRSTDPLRRFDGQHRKIMIFGDQEMVGGGMNFGDVYSHMGPESTPKWRDTDIHVKGPAAFDAQKLFTDLWNEQIAKRGVIDGKTLSPIELKTPIFKNSGNSKMTLVNHQPGRDENIYRANLIAIEGASKTINIQNAYVILDPATYKALLRAKKRGVRVRVMTNSLESVDEPIVSFPIMESVNRMAKQSFEVYVKKGPTLHSKAMTVDGIYSWIGSHNFHPRSFRYEGEVTMNVLDSKFTKKVDDMIQADIDQATQINKPITLPKNIQANGIGFYLYDQL